METPNEGAQKRRRRGTGEKASQLKTDSSRYKTKLCSSWVERGSCVYEENCQFAHGKEDLRSPVFGDDKAKTKLCEQWSTYGSCSYEHVCRFAHGEHELRPLPSRSREKERKRRKTVDGREVCRDWLKGQCKRDPCKYHHSDAPSASATDLLPPDLFSPLFTEAALLGSGLLPQPIYLLPPPPSLLYPLIQQPAQHVSNEIVDSFAQ
eukprot:EG_transcript_29375